MSQLLLKFDRKSNTGDMRLRLKRAHCYRRLTHTSCLNLLATSQNGVNQDIAVARYYSAGCIEPFSVTSATLQML